MPYHRPLARIGGPPAAGAVPLAGGWAWFDAVEELSRSEPPRLIPAAEIPAEALERLAAPRPPVAGLDWDAPRVMGILNATPDSFSDGGEHLAPDAALAHALGMIRAGADIVDVGGESTRPGAREVPEEEEIRRTAPVIAALRRDCGSAISIDTRKAAVARAAHEAGATLVNDVSGLCFDPAMAPFCAGRDLPVCVMHAQGDPETMQADPRYGNVLLDVYDFLEARIRTLGEAGIPRSRIIVDPGIGFGKTLKHNLDLIANISLFHGLGCPILLGASRKRFIGEIGGAPEARDRVAGSVAVALAAAAQGVQALRVHDVGETAQALRLWRAATAGAAPV